MLITVVKGSNTTWKIQNVVKLEQGEKRDWRSRKFYLNQTNSASSMRDWGEFGGKSEEEASLIGVN